MSDMIGDNEYVTRIEYEAEQAAVRLLQQDRETLKAALLAAGIAIPPLVSE